MKNLNLTQNISGADAPGRGYSSAPWIYISNTSFNQKEELQNGRSMIEMLGVLAIIGVLSVGGIAGYSKAMMKYRINKTIEQITLIAGNVRTFFAPQGNYEGLASATANGKKIIQKAKLVPDEMWDGNDIKTVFGQAALYSVDGGFRILLNKLPIEACIEISILDWGNIASGIYSMTLDDGSTEDEDYENAGVSESIGCDGGIVSDKAVVVCANGRNLSFPAHIDTITEICSHMDGSGAFILSFK